MVIKNRSKNNEGTSKQKVTPHENSATTDKRNTKIKCTCCTIWEMNSWHVINNVLSYTKLEVSAHFHFLFIPAKSITHDFQGLTKEEEIYDLQWKLINDDMRNMLPDATEAFSFFTYGKFCTLHECYRVLLEMVRLINAASSAQSY